MHSATNTTAKETIRSAAAEIMRDMIKRSRERTARASEHDRCRIAAAFCSASDPSDRADAPAR